MADDDKAPAPGNWFPELDSQAEPSADSPAGKDPGPGNWFPEIGDQKVATKKPGFDLGAAVKRGLPAMATNILPGMLEIPEQMANLMQYGNRLPPLPGAVLDAMGGPTLSAMRHGLIPPIIAGANKLAGAPAQPYMDVTGAIGQNPQLGWEGQTPQQLMQQHPLAGQVGRAVGQLPQFLAGGGGAIAKGAALPLRLAASALEGGAITSGAAGLQEAGEEIKSNDTVDPIHVGKAAIDNFLPGALLGGAARGLGEAAGAVGKRFAKFFPPWKKGTVEAEVMPPELPGPSTTKLLPGPWDVHPPAPPPQRVIITPGPLKPEPGPKLIEKKLIPPSPAERARMGNELYVPPFRLQGEVSADVNPPAATSTPRAAKPPKDSSGVTVTTGAKPKTKPQLPPADPPPPPDVVESRVEDIVDPDKSWRGAREAAGRPVTAQEEKLARDFARVRVEHDVIRARLRGALRVLHKEFGFSTPYRTGYIEPKYALELKEIARHLGGTPDTNIFAAEATLSPESKFPETYNFMATTKLDKMKEIEKLDKDFQKIEAKYNRFKENHEEEFHETFPLNETVRVNVRTKEWGDKSVNIRMRWQPSEYVFPTPGQKATYLAEKAARIEKSAPYEEFTTPAFKSAVNQALDRGTHLELEGLADADAFKWFNKLGKSTQAKIVLAVGATAAAYLGSQQGAEAAPEVPPKLVAGVVKKLYQGGWREWMGSRPITRLTKLDLTTDMIRGGFDAESKKFFALRMAYLAKVKRANVGARHMTPVEKEATAGLPPRDLRRTDKLPKWTPIEKQKAGDIAYYNQEYKAALKAEMARLAAAGVQPGHFKRAARYARGVQIDAHDMGIDLGRDAEGRAIDPLGSSTEILDKLTGEVMKAEFLGNLRVAIYHVHEAFTATVSKYPGATVRAFRGLASDPVYRDYAKANSPHGFFQQLLENQSGFKYRQKIDTAINKPIDDWLKAHIGQKGYDALSAQLPEQAKLGLNAVVIAEEEAKNYPGGARQYMQDWLASANKRQAVPPERETEFAKVALKTTIEENAATGSLPDGLLKERTVFQRTKAFTLVIAYTRGKIQQSRFVFSLLDDTLEALAKGDQMGAAKSMRAFLMASVMIFGAAGSAAVPPYIWAALEQVDRVEHGNTEQVEKIKDALDAAQKNIGPGYQIRHLGVAGAPVTTVPSGAVASVAGQMHMPANKKQIVSDVANALTLGLISRIGPSGILNLRYMTERIYQGITGTETFKQYEEGIANVLMAKAAGKPAKLTQTPLEFDLFQGILHALAPVQNAKEVEQIQRAEKKSNERYPRNVATAGRKLQRALRK